MAGLLPTNPDPAATQAGDQRVGGVDGDDADDLLAALSSTTARELLAALHDEPMTASAVADRVDTSLQNTQYHLEKLERADVIRVVDTAYSEKGREMNVYAPADQPLVVFAGREEQTTGLKTALSRLLGGLGVLGLVSLAIQQVFGDGFAPPGGSADSADDGDPGGFAAGDQDAATPEPTYQAEELETAASTPTEQAVDLSANTVDAADQAAQAAGLPPGLVFFAGGALVMCLVFGWWYLRAR
jgi:DNA-binding transcriptional ArsR family regulator